MSEDLVKSYAPGEDRTHDLQIALFICDYETDALPTALPRHIYARRKHVAQIVVFITCTVNNTRDYTTAVHRSFIKKGDLKRPICLLEG